MEDPDGLEIPSAHRPMQYFTSYQIKVTYVWPPQNPKNKRLLSPKIHVKNPPSLPEPTYSKTNVSLAA